MDVGGLWLVPPYPYMDGHALLVWKAPRQVPSRVEMVGPEGAPALSKPCRSPQTWMRLSNSSLCLHEPSSFKYSVCAFHQLILFTRQQIPNSWQTLQSQSSASCRFPSFPAYKDLLDPDPSDDSSSSGSPRAFGPPLRRHDSPPAPELRHIHTRPRPPTVECSTHRAERWLALPHSPEKLNA